MFKILARTLLSPRFLFCQQKQSLLVLTRELLSQHKNYQPWRNVRLMHAITMARYDPQLASSAIPSAERQEEEQIQQIIDSLSGELHALPHRELNMLMEVLRERGFRYDRTLPLAKAVNKQTKLLLSRHFQAAELNKTLALCKQLAFPKTTWVKIVESYLQLGQERVKNEQNLRMNAVQFFKFVILALEEPYLHLPATKTIIQKLLKLNANSLDTLTSLYHISKVLPSSLKAKIQYQLARSNVREILFNPYTQMEEPQKESEPQEEANDHKEVLKEKLNELSSQILKIFHSSVDQAKLEQSIVKSMESDVEPLTKQAILFASDILQLKPIISQYLGENYTKLTPIEFLHLLRKCPSQSTHSLLREYYQQLGKHMSIEEKAYLHLESHRFLRTAIDPHFIAAIISQSPALTYSEFMAISRLIAQLPESGKAHIPELLALIKSKSG